MFNYYCLNPIAQVGLNDFTSDFEKTDEVNHAEGILVRSAVMHDMQFDEKILCIARAGAGTNNIPLDRCAQEGIVVQYTGANRTVLRSLSLQVCCLQAVIF